jgi:uncharacterized membrane protein
MAESKAYLAKLLALAAGIEYMTVVYKLPQLGNHSLSVLFALTVVLLGSVTVALVVCAGKGSETIVPLLVFIGVASGITIEAFLDTKVDHNLFPLEIIFWSVFVAPTLAASSALGRFLKNKTFLKDRVAE